MRESDSMMAAGLLCLTAAAPSVQLPIIGLAGLALLVAGVGLLIGGGVVARARGVSGRRAAAGLLAVTAGAVGLAVLILAGSGVAHAEALYADRQVGPPPSAGNWVRLAVAAPIPPIALALGLWARARYPGAVCLAWGLAALAVLPIGLGVFLALADVLPLDA